MRISYILNLICNDDIDRLLLFRIMKVKPSIIQDIRSSLLQFKVNVMGFFDDDSDVITEYTIPLEDHYLHSPLLKIIKRRWNQITSEDYKLLRKFWSTPDIYLDVLGFRDNTIDDDMPYAKLSLRMMSRPDRGIYINIYGYNNDITVTIDRYTMDIIIHHDKEVYTEYEYTNDRTIYTYDIKKECSYSSCCRREPSSIKDSSKYMREGLHKMTRSFNTREDRCSKLEKQLVNNILNQYRIIDLIEEGEMSIPEGILLFDNMLRRGNKYPR